MSVLIKDMEMPKNCDSCPFLDDIGPYANCTLLHGYIALNRMAENWRLEDCPLVELEENRMYCLKDGVVYMSNVAIPKGKTVTIPGNIEFMGGRNERTD